MEPEIEDKERRKRAGVGAEEAERIRGKTDDKQRTKVGETCVFASESEIAKVRVALGWKWLRGTLAASQFRRESRASPS